MKKILQIVTLNFVTIVILLTLFGAPVYFARNFNKVAGVKTESAYLLVSQIAKFPNLKYEQIGESYKVSITKQAESQAFLSVFIINNPTKTNKTYSINTATGDSRVFFGEGLKNPQTQITAPAGSSIPISILSKASSNTDLIEFTIKAN